MVIVVFLGSAACFGLFAVLGGLWLLLPRKLRETLGVVTEVVGGCLALLVGGVVMLFLVAYWIFGVR